MQHLLLNFCCCSAPPSATRYSPDDEGVENSSGAVFKAHFAHDEINAVFLSAGGPSDVEQTCDSAPIPPPPPASLEPNDKDTTKIRLQELIRDFAKEAVGAGIAVEAKSSGGIAVEARYEQCLLRMDRGLRVIELWTRPGEGDSTTMQVSLSLAQVESLAKGSSPHEPSTHPAERVLIIRRHAGYPDMTLVFESLAMRDKAHTCIRIFQMSVEQSSPSREGSQSGNDPL